MKIYWRTDKKKRLAQLSRMDYPKSFPPRAFHVEPHTIVLAEKLALMGLIEQNASETIIDKFLNDCPALLGACMNFTQFGHHGTWVVGQQMVRPTAPPGIHGLV